MHLLVITGLPVKMRFSSKYDCALRVFLPTSIFQLLLCGSIFCFLRICLLTLKKVKNIITLCYYLRVILSTSQADSGVKGCVVSMLLYHLIGHFGFFWRLYCRLLIPRLPFRLRHFSNIQALACEQALLGALVAGWEKEGELATTSQEFEYLCQKSQCKYNDDWLR